jgi:hypothetical protein
LLVDFTDRTSTINPFSPVRTPPASSAATSTEGTADFEAQLSSAISESLKKLGAAPGEVNITIRNPTATTRQILFTYSVSEETAGPVTPATVPAAEAPAKLMGWSPYSGPRDVRDGMPEGGGQLTASGAPLIKPNATAASNQYGYTGPAATNPYFSTPSNPLRQGYVHGFQNWFEDAMIVGGLAGPVPANKIYYATEEGAQEALRIVQQFSPGATIVKTDPWFSGPFSIDRPSYNIDLGGGKLLNAGGVLHSYYHQGYGVTAYSDETIRRSIELA